MNESDKGAYGHVLKYTGIFGGVQGLNVIVSLMRNKFVALLLGPSGMGLVTLFNTTVQFISQSTHFGISMSAVRHLSEYPDDDHHPQIEHFVKVVRAWSMLTAMILTPVSSRQSSYTSAMASSSRLQGLHQVAKKSMMNGLPLFDSVSVDTGLPLRSFSSAFGNWALTALTMPVKAINTNSFFIFLCLLFLICMQSYEVYS